MNPLNVYVLYVSYQCFYNRYQGDVVQITSTCISGGGGEGGAVKARRAADHCLSRLSLWCLKWIFLMRPWDVFFVCLLNYSGSCA